MKNLEQVIESFTSTLRGVYHPRIQYPKSEGEVITRPIPNRIPDVDTPPISSDLEPLPTEDKPIT
jgi:hypothetical protein